MGPGEASGMAVLLGYPDYNIGDPYGSTARNVPGPGGGVQQQKLMKDLIGPEQPVQLDAAGMTELYYKSLNGIRDFAAKMLGEGIDVTQAPDPRDPRSLEAVTLFNQALETHNMNAERLRQGKENQDILKNMMLNGQALGSPQLFSPDQGPIGAMDMHQMAFSQAPDFIDEYNNVLSQQPRNREDAQAMQQFYDDAIREIDELERTKTIPSEAAQYYKSLLKPPGQYDSRLDDLKLQTEATRADSNRALAQQRRASAALSKARIKDLKNKARTAGLGKETTREWPRLVQLAEFMSNAKQTQASGERVNVEDFKDVFSGSFLGGDKKNAMAFEDIYINPDGDFTMRYSKDVNDSIGEPTGRKSFEEISFNEDNLFDAFTSNLTPSQKNTLEKEMSKSNILDDGKLTMRGVLKFHNRANNKYGLFDGSQYSAEDAKSLVSLGPDEFTRKVVASDPNITEYELEAFWEHLNELSNE